MSQNFNGNVSIDGELTANNVSSDNNAQILARTQIQFTDTSGAINYIGKNVGNLTISAGTHIFTNCTGVINYSGTAAKLYINNCPSLSVSGKNETNWRNIYVDGVAEYEALNNLTPLQGVATTPLLPNDSLQVGDELEISFRSRIFAQTNTALYKFKDGQGSSIVRIGDTQAESPSSTNQFYAKIVIYTNCECRGVWYVGSPSDGLAIDNITLRRYSK